MLYIAEHLSEVPCSPSFSLKARSDSYSVRLHACTIKYYTYVNVPFSRVPDYEQKHLRCWQALFLGTFVLKENLGAVCLRDK